MSKNATNSRFVVHLGQQIHDYIYNHTISKDDWSRIYDCCLKLGKLKVAKLKRYSYDDIFYEFAQKSHPICFHEHYQLIELKPRYLQYQLEIEIKNFDFQPINQYYNVYEIQRSEILIDKLNTTVCFEEKTLSGSGNKTYEIKISAKNVADIHLAITDLKEIFGDFL
jgi:hypothetical protein